MISVMDINKYAQPKQAADLLNVSREWTYGLAKTYQWRSAIVFGHRVWLLSDILKTPPTSTERRSLGQKKSSKRKVRNARKAT